MGRTSTLHGGDDGSDLQHAVDPLSPADDAQRWRDAADRWKRRTPQRERKKDALRAGDYIEADTPDRLARWVERHEKWFDALQPGTAPPAALPPGAAPEAEERPTFAETVVDLDRPLRRGDVSNELVERIVGRTRDLLSVEFFEMGLLAARCVGLVSTRGQANGTGFLVAPGLMLTNEHVLRTAAEAGDSDLELDFEDNRVGEAKRTEIFRLRPETFFLAHKALDFALVAVDLQSQNGTKLDSFSVLPLIGEEGKVRIGEAVNVVQHPGGRVKQIAIRNNQLVDLPEGPEMGAFFHYEADTEKGSSGAPVFNDFWEVVALHHSGVPRTDEQGRLVDANGKVLGAGDAEQYEWVANEGVRVSRIVAAVAAAELPEHMHAVREKALRAWELRGQPAAAVEAPLSPVSDPPGTAPQESVTVRSAPPGTHQTDIGLERGPSVVEVTVPVRLRISVVAEPATDD
jgi:endonuclease G